MGFHAPCPQLDAVQAHFWSLGVSRDRDWQSSGSRNIHTPPPPPPSLLLPPSSFLPFPNHPTLDCTWFNI